MQADLEAARSAEMEAKRQLAEEAEHAARQAAAQSDVSAQLGRVQVGILYSQRPRAVRAGRIRA